MKRILFVLILVATTGSLSAFSQTRDPAATVKAFYSFSDARSPIFDQRHVSSRKRWYTSELYKAFLGQLFRDKTYLRKHPTDKPYFGDGLDFKPLDEPCTADGNNYSLSYRIGKEAKTGSRASVNVIFAYPKGCKLESIVYRVDLRKIQGRWLISDWHYPDGSSLINDLRKQTYGD